MRLVSIRLAVLAACVYLAQAAIAAPPQKVDFAGASGGLNGWLYTPEGAGPHPAVVALHGCGGLTDAAGVPQPRFAAWGALLTAQGFLVLFPDSFGSRGLGSQCRQSQRVARASRERIDDAEAARAYLAARPDVKATAISLLGWSNGGSTVLYALEPRHAPSAGADFAAAVALYPGCREPLESRRWAARLPLLILVGAADDWVGAEPCLDLIAKARASGGAADIVTYAGAYHDFDAPDTPVHVVRHLAFTVSGTGEAHAGTDAAARQDAMQRVPAYLPR